MSGGTCRDSRGAALTARNTATMGAGLKKQFLAFEQLMDSAALASVKHETNDWEAEYAAVGQHTESREL